MRHFLRNFCAEGLLFWNVKFRGNPHPSGYFSYGHRSPFVKYMLDPFFAWRADIRSAHPAAWCMVAPSSCQMWFEQLNSLNKQANFAARPTKKTEKGTLEGELIRIFVCEFVAFRASVAPKPWNIAEPNRLCLFKAKLKPSRLILLPDRQRRPRRVPWKES